MPKLRLLLEAAFWLLVARASLALVPFPKIGRYLGTLQKPADDAAAPDAAHAAEARLVGRTVATAADHLPLSMVCLPRALAGWQMLHRRGITSRLHFGAVRLPIPGKPGLNTHAWLSCNGVEVTGYPEAHDCVELGYFSRSVQAAPVKQEVSLTGG